MQVRKKFEVSVFRSGACRHFMNVLWPLSVFYCIHERKQEMGGNRSVKFLGMSVLWKNSITTKKLITNRSHHAAERQGREEPQNTERTERRLLFSFSPVTRQIIFKQITNETFITWNINLNVKWVMFWGLYDNRIDMPEITVGLKLRLHNSFSIPEHGKDL